MYVKSIISEIVTRENVWEDKLHSEITMKRFVKQAFVDALYCILIVVSTWQTYPFLLYNQTYNNWLWVYIINVINSHISTENIQGLL